MQDAQLTIRLPSILDARVRDLAARLGIRPTDLTRIALQRMLPLIEANGLSPDPPPPAAAAQHKEAA